MNILITGSKGFVGRNLVAQLKRREGLITILNGLATEYGQRVKEGVTILETQGRGAKRNLRMVADYQMPNVSEKVARIILSYADYVNRFVWHKK
jgi:UDP-N-acetylglucosamine 2-epimerase (non-hydrolysing)